MCIKCLTCCFSQQIQGHSNFALFYLQIKLQGDHFPEISYPFCFLYCLILILGLIHANHGGEITDYLLNQLKDASTDVSFFFGSYNINITIFFIFNSQETLIYCLISLSV